MKHQMLTRQEARAKGLTRYFTGRPCAQGHIAERHTTNSTCVDCSAEKSKAWDKANPGRKRDRTIASQKRHPERIREQQKRFREKTKDKRSSAMKAWYAANKDRMRELNRKWVEANRSKLYARQSARRAIATQATPAWLTDADKLAIQSFYTEARRITKETGIKHHVDHIMPLNGDMVSGLHVPWNLRVIPAAENTRKKNKVLPEMALAYI